MRAPSRIVITGSSICRHATCGGRHRARPSRASRSAGSHEPRPGQPPVPPPELVEPGRHARDRARAGADRVVDELLAERHLELDSIAPPRPARHRDEEVEVRDAAPTPRRGRSRGRRRADPSSPSRRRTRRGTRRPPRRPRSRRPRGSRRPPPPSPDGLLQPQAKPSSATLLGDRAPAPARPLFRAGDLRGRRRHA